MFFVIFIDKNTTIWYNEIAKDSVYIKPTS